MTTTDLVRRPSAAVDVPQTARQTVRAPMPKPRLSVGMFLALFLLALVGVFFAGFLLSV
ncbi:hypothetical protein [Plantactinospora sp. WMMB782]|uniref:hypothetical protein n=1 Tax=Plantactinospora sp. WMMB782 TaxID=3404121 RepID=UPI003B96084A